MILLLVFFIILLMCVIFSCLFMIVKVSLFLIRLSVLCLKVL